MKKKNFLIIGHSSFARTEAIRDYFLYKDVENVYILYLDIAFSKKKEARLEYYSFGKLVYKKQLYSYRFNLKKKNYLKIILTYLNYICSIIKSRFLIKKKIDYIISVGSIISIISYIFFKKLNYTKSKFIFYCIDYFNLHKKNDFLNIKYFINKIEKNVQNYLLRESDYIWEITEAISIKRNDNILEQKTSKKKFIVPLGYSDQEINSIVKLNNVKKNDTNQIIIGFVGLINQNQGLQFLVEAIKKLNYDSNNNIEIIVNVIGAGPYLEELKELIKKENVERNFKIHGFLDNNKLSKILSQCDFGYAVFPNSIDNHSLNAEPGKIKKYFIYGLPVIISDNIYISKLIKNYAAGIILKPSSNDLLNILNYDLLKNKLEIKKNAKLFFKHECYSSKHFDFFFKKISII